MQASVPLPSEGTSGHAGASEQQSSSDESSHHKAKISRLNAEVKQLKADKQALLARLTSAEQEEEADEEEVGGGGKLAKLDTEVAQLKTDRQLLISRVGAVEQMLAEARRATDQKEGHLQGLQVGADLPLSSSSSSKCLVVLLTSPRNMIRECGHDNCAANRPCRL